MAANFRVITIVNASEMYLSFDEYIYRIISHLSILYMRYINYI